MPSLQLIHRLGALGVIAAASLLSVPSSADTFVAEDYYLDAGGLDPMTIRAVQQALKDKGFYSGPVDGQFEQSSKLAVIKFRAANHIVRPAKTRMKLDRQFVQALFGIRNLSLEGWKDEQCLLFKLGKVPEEEAKGTCRR